ncbi:TetR/AcrR family transcriptional regulator [Mycolicibacterium litorale]|uniref:TetR/AcrR family transcriptional regulator n=1 Tax=Mycolicibacterium litorale TaxID=758802 RepID=UPI003CF823C4
MYAFSRGHGASAGQGKASHQPRAVGECNTEWGDVPKTKTADARVAPASSGDSNSSLKGDPQRRLRIVEAVIAVVAEKGLAGVTHRSVADKAGVPLGSTTYYFKDKDELTIAAIELMASRTIARTEELLADYAERGLDVVDSLVKLTVELNADLDDLVVSYRLFLAPLNRLPLLESARRCESAWYDTLHRFLVDRVDRHAADALGYMFEGIAVRAVTMGRAVTEDEIAPVFRRLFQSDASLPVRDRRSRRTVRRTTAG